MTDAPSESHLPTSPDTALPPLRWWMPLLVLAAGLAAWWGSLGGDLVYDDLILVGRNPNITSFEHAGEAFGSAYWDFVDDLTAVRVGYFRPLSRLGLTVGWWLNGDGPLAYHAISLTAHLLASLTVLLLARRLLRSSHAAVWAALVFCVHPLQVEAVAWISALNDPIHGLFVLLALLAHLRWRDRGSPGPSLLAPLLLGVALLSKEAALVAPAAMLAVDLARTSGALRARALPFWRAFGPHVAVGAGYFLWRVQVFDEWTGGFGRTTTDLGITLARQVTLRLELLGGWLGLLAWPADLSLFRPVRPNLGLGDPPVLLALVGLGAVLGLAVLLVRRGERRLLAALAIVPVALLPTFVRIEGLGQFPLSDRFAYVAVAGFAMLLAGGALRLVPGAVGALLLALVVAALGVRTVSQVRVWDGEEVLYRTQIEREPDSIYARWSLGRVLLNRYRDGGSRDVEVLREALTTLEHGQALLVESQRPGSNVWATSEDFLQTHLGVAWCYLFLADLDGFRDYSTSIELFEIAAERLPFDDRAWIGLGTTHNRAGDLVAAEQAYKEALKRNPASPEANRNYGLLLVDMRDLRRARYHFERSLAARPDNLEDLVHIASCWHDDGWPQEAEKVARHAIEVHPQATAPLRILANGAAMRGDHGAALSWLDRALAIDGREGSTWLLRGKVLKAMDQDAEAILALRNACEHLPASFEAHDLLGMILLQTGALDGARPYLDRAYRLGSTERTSMLRLRDALGTILRDDPDALLSLAQVDADRDEAEGAMQLVGLALEAEPAHPGATIQRSALLRALGRGAEATGSLEVLVAEHPRSFDAALEFGLVLRQAGRLEEALLHLSRALELLPASAPPQLTRPVDQLIGEIQASLGG